MVTVIAGMVRDAKEGDVRTAVFHAILVGIAALSGLSRLIMTFFLLYCAGLHGRVANGSMDNGIFYPFARFWAEYNNDNTVCT